VTWIRGLESETAEAVVDLAGLALLSDGVAPLSGHVLEAIAGGEDEYLLLTEGTRIAGLAVAHEHDPAELFVVPHLRGLGLGTRLVNSALAKAGAVWAHGDLPAARALSGKLGLTRSRELLQMRRALDPIWAAGQVAAAPWPTGVRLRTFVPGQDEQQFLDVNARAFEWHPEQGRLSLGGLRQEMSQPWFDQNGLFLAVDDADTVLGFHWTKVHPALPASIELGEVHVLGVDPLAMVGGRPVRGLGGPLTAAGMAYLAARGLRAVMLYVEGDNVRALRLYRRLGFETFSIDVVYRLPA
jgi:mycothiol synthase